MKREEYRYGTIYIFKYRSQFRSREEKFVLFLGATIILISKIVKHILRDRSRIWDDVEISYESRVTYFIGTR